MPFSLSVRHCVLLATLALAGAVPVAHAQITIDLSYVDTQSVQYQRFKNWVDQAVAGNPGYAFSASEAATMYKLTGQNQYADLAIAMVEAQVSAAETAIAGGNRPEVAGDSYLHVGAMIGDLALTLDWCKTRISTNQQTRWAAYAEQTVWNVWNPTQAQWGGNAFPWSGWSINDPANNYYYSFLQATMYWALASNTGNWDTLLNTKWQALASYMGSVQGGGSEEGTGYGLSHARVFELYRVWRDATGTNFATQNSHLNDSIAWWIHATVPTFAKTAAIGDQSRVSEPVIYDYHRNLMLQARAMASTQQRRDNASWWLNNIPIQQMTSGFNLHNDLLPAGSNGVPPAELVYVAPTTGHVFARTGWDRNAMWMAFTAGKFDQSHAHQEQGAFTLFEGDWLAVTSNIWTHSGIQAGTEVNNMLRFTRNGDIVTQRSGTTSTMAVTPGNNGNVHIVANLTPAYNGDSAVGSWQRTVDFVDRHLTVQDDFTLGSGTSAVFQVNVPVQPIISGQTARAGNLLIEVLEPANASFNIIDWTTQPDDTWHQGWRLDISGSSSRYKVRLGSVNPIFSDGFEASPP